MIRTDQYTEIPDMPQSEWERIEEAAAYCAWEDAQEERRAEWLAAGGGK